MDAQVNSMKGCPRPLAVQLTAKPPSVSASVLLGRDDFFQHFRVWLDQREQQFARELPVFSGALRPTQRRPAVRKLIVTEFVSLDGVMEAPGGEAVFAHAGWVAELDRKSVV